MAVGLALPGDGSVAVQGQTVRFTRPGLTEEYSVSMDGVRQDFVVTEKLGRAALPRRNAQAEQHFGPTPDEELRLELSVSGARVEPAVYGACPVRYSEQIRQPERGNPLSHGATLVLEQSGRKIAWSRLRASDANGKELPARIEVGSARRADRGEEALGESGQPAAVSARPPYLTIVVDDTDAIYPVRIDPTFSDANWVSMGGIPGINSIIDGEVSAAVTDGSGNLYIGGAFTIVGNAFANNIAEWKGSSWSALGSGMGGYTGVAVFALAVSGSTLYAGGGFTTAGGSAANNIAQWNGSTWSALGSGMTGGEYEGYVYALAVSGSTLYAGGDFTNAGGSAANAIAQWNGSSWSPLGSGMGAGEYGGTVDALAVSGSTLYAGGYFTTAGGSAATNIAQWNGSSWSAFGSGMNNQVSALAVSGSTLYAGGFFTTAGSDTNANYIAQWNGSSWSALGSGIPGVGDGDGPFVSALAVSGSTLYAGGDFSTAGGTAASCIAQWNGSSWSALGSGMNYQVNALAVSGSTLYAGGYFTTAGGKVSAYAAAAYLVAPPGGLVDSIDVPASGTADVRCYGNPGQQFGVQRTTNLSPPLWTNVNSSPLSPAADGSFTFVDTNAPQAPLFTAHSNTNPRFFTDRTTHLDTSSKRTIMPHGNYFKGLRWAGVWFQRNRPGRLQRGHSGQHGPANLDSAPNQSARQRAALFLRSAVHHQYLAFLPSPIIALKPEADLILSFDTICTFFSPFGAAWVPMSRTAIQRQHQWGRVIPRRGHWDQRWSFNYGASAKT